MNTRFKWAEKDGIPKFEEMMILSHYLGDLTFMVNWTMKLTMGRWYFYCVEEDMFPLTDSPILVQPDNVMAALSPRLLLEIDRSDHSNESGWSTANFIKPQKLDEFRRRTIENTHREIIFGHRPLLEQWQSTAEFARQHEAVVNSRKKDKGVA